MFRGAFAPCASCGHEVGQIPLDPDGALLHHITRSRLYGLPHRPSGHVLTPECRRRGCRCRTPAQPAGVGIATRVVGAASGFDP